MYPFRPVLYLRPSRQFEVLNRRSRNGERSSLVRSLIHSARLDQHCTVNTPRKAKKDELYLAHSRHYLRLLRYYSLQIDKEDDENVVEDSEDESDDDFGSDSESGAEQLEEAGLVDDCPVFPGVWQLEMLTVGGSVVAAESLIHGEASIACWFEGGRHHAAADSAGGFCYLNDVVVACKVLSSSSRFSKILYLDMDVHHGDGVESAFLFTNTVATMSLHLCEPGFYPNTTRQIFPAQGKTRNAAVRVPLRRGIDDNMYTKTFVKTTETVYKFHNPEVIVLQCGVDGVCGDPLGGFNLTGRAYNSCVRHVLSYQKPTLILGGGGYHPANAARVWADVLECCVTEARGGPAENAAESALRNARDIPISDEYFESYGPSFSRDIRPQSLKNENTIEELNDITAQIAEQLKPP